jgi:hypothetical protein
MSHMMMSDCGVGMMVVGWLGGLVGLAFLVSVTVLVWVVIGRLRQEPMTPAVGR